MAIWSGYGGGLQLQRADAGPAYVWVEPGDVDELAKRMAAGRAISALVSGDYVAVFLVDENGIVQTTPLPFMAAGAWQSSERYSDGQWYVNVDPMGGIRFYSDWSQSLEGNFTDALPLLPVSDRCRIRVSLVGSDDRCLAQTESWDLNTNREIADITSLGEGFAKNMATLVSGSGSLDCFFSAGQDKCESGTEQEKSIYLHRLALRQEIGANFVGVFLLKREGHTVPDLSDEYDNRKLFYLCNCVITGVASTVAVDETIHSRIDFVTTDEIKLLYDYPKGHLIQEGVGADKILQENDSGILVDLPI